MHTNPTTTTTGEVSSTTCSSKLGGAVENAGVQWVKVAEIENNRNHINSESTDAKLSDAEINSLRRQGTGKLWMQCGTITAFLDEPDTPFDAVAAGGAMINQCSNNVNGPFQDAANHWGGHKSIDCWAMGIETIY